MKLPTPTLTEQFEPERSTLTFSIEKAAIKMLKQIKIRLETNVKGAPAGAPFK